jgi:hypothetical protein
MRLAGVVALVLVVAAAAPVAVSGPAAAAAPGTAESGVARTSVSGGTADGITFTGARLWDRGVNWCDLQPTADADVATQAAARLGPLLDELVASGAQRVIIPLGHSAPWVFGDSPQSQAPATRWSKGTRAIWFCGGHASAVSVPQPATLRPASDGSKPLQYQYFENYVDALMGYVQTNYADRFAVTFQVMNEPNLLNGIDVKAKVAGAATTTAAAVASVVAMESITANLIRTRYPAFALVSTAIYQKDNDFARRYLRAQATRHNVSAIAYNVYSRKKTATTMVMDWDARVAKARTWVRRHSSLRGLPLIITETNHNLINHNPADRSNLKPSITSASAQAQLAAATVMNASFRGFRDVYWLPAPPGQAAVNLAPGTPAQAAMLALSTATQGMRLTGCRWYGSLRGCNYQDPTGVRPAMRIMWRQYGSARYRLPRGAQIATVWGATSSASVGTRIKVGTTPLILTWL